MALLYDISRLSARILMDAPNGIDRVDMMLARHLLHSAAHDPQVLLFGFFGPRLFQVGAIPDPLAPLDRLWSESDTDDPGALPASVVAALRLSDAPRVREQAPPGGFDRKLARMSRIAGALGRYAWRRGRSPTRSAPHGAIYFNASHFPLEWRRHMAWLDARRDIRPVAFIHDLLPVSHPQFFWDSEPAKHAARLTFLAKRGAGAVVTSHAVADALRDHLAGLGRTDLPLCVAPLPVGEIFHRPMPVPADLAKANYFLACGTIEPRKNHHLLVSAWRTLVAEQGPDAPALLVVGKRGWHCEAIVSAMHDPALQGRIVELNDIATPTYRRLLSGARALLAPSLAEGFGLPVAEALTAGVPVIASDIPAHREQGDAAVLLDPARADDWAAMVRDFSKPESRARQAALERTHAWRPIDRGTYLATIDAFLSGL